MDDQCPGFPTHARSDVNEATKFEVEAEAEATDHEAEAKKSEAEAELIGLRTTPNKVIKM
jgi:hypothetical protein